MRAALGVERERVDDSWAAVHHVHGATVRAPTDSVGDRQAVEHLLGPAGPVQPVERAASGVMVVGQGPGPEPPLRIGGTVVHPGPGRRDLRDGSMGALGRQVDEAAPGAEQPPPVALDGRDHADGPGQLVDADGDQRSVVLDPVAVDAPGQDVDPQHLRAAVVPPHPLSELGLLGCAGDGNGASLSVPGHHQAPKSTTTLMSSGPRLSASAMSFGGTRRVISRSSHARSAAASASAAL